MSDYSYRDLNRDSERLYNHLLDLRKAEPPDAIIDRLHFLFIDATRYLEHDILQALYRIALSKRGAQEFPLIINRCCYILINYWWLQPGFERATIDLVSLFTTSTGVPENCLAAQRVRELVKQFVHTAQFNELQDRARTVGEPPKVQQNAQNQPIRHLIQRYPYLYSYCLLNWDTSELGQQAVRHIQAKREREFELALLHYTTKLVRQAGNSHAVLCEDADNPTLLDPQQLKNAIKQFASKSEGSLTYKESARLFLRSTYKVATYQELKWKLHDYLTSSIQYSSNPKYGKFHFNDWLYETLKNTLPQNDHLKPSGALLVQTCGQLLSEIVARPEQLNNHFIFVDMNSNLGATFTVALLMKLVLLFQDARSQLEQIKAHLAHRFAVTLKYYETKVRGEINWLVECLENLMVALSIHFGRTDFGSKLPCWVNML